MTATDLPRVYRVSRRTRRLILAFTLTAPAFLIGTSFLSLLGVTTIAAPPAPLVAIATAALAFAITMVAAVERRVTLYPDAAESRPVDEPTRQVVMTLVPNVDELETDRLILRRMTRDDLPFFARIQADPEVARYIGPGRPRTDAESLAWLEMTLLSYELLQLGQLAVVRKADNALVGRCGLSHHEVELPPYEFDLPRGCQGPGCMPAGIPIRTEPELGYTFDRAAWGNGYAREAAGKIFSYATKVRGLSGIVSVIHPDNARSSRVARSFGAVLVDRVRTGGLVLDRYVWPEEVG